MAVDLEALDRMEDAPSWAALVPAAPDEAFQGEAAPVPEPVEKAYARLFAADVPDARRVLDDLRSRTLEAALPPSSPDAELRHVEGQRALVRYILNRVAEGRRA